MQDCLNRRVHPTEVCRKSAVRLEPLCANTGFFDTSAERLRAGLSEGKFLIRMVSVAGIEPRTY